MKVLNIIALLIFLGGGTAVLLLDTEVTRAIQGKVMGLFSPFIHASSTITSSTKDVMGPKIDPRELMRENERLRLEVQKLRITSQRHDELLQENNSLRRLVAYKQNAPFKNLVAARVLKRSSATWWNTMIIDKGSNDGVVVDAPVVTDVGLVGKISRVAPQMSEVTLLTDETCRVAAGIEGTHEKGILNGERAGIDVRPDLRLRFLSQNAPVNVGAAVYSTGDGRVFPPGVLLGKVKRFERGEISGEAIVESAVDFSLIEDVFVLERKAETP
ncbi:MAG: rod shape-determining protein MreC [Verrucomicrobiaceae bacterium]|nr:rod shape-determining protein MreC [Verrucomicrobiaceae bacterium]